MAVQTPTVQGIALMLTDMTTPPPAAYYAAWGTGPGVASDGDLTLFSEDLSTPRVLCTLTQGTGGAGAGTAMAFHAVIVATSIEIITNTGVFTAPTGGTMIWHNSFTGVPVGAGGLPSITVDVVYDLDDF